MNDSPRPRFEVYPTHLSRGDVKTPTGEFAWRFRAANGQISAVSGEQFTRQEDAERAVRQLCDAVWIGEGVRASCVRVAE
jgi:hypothetical protein